MVCFSYVDSDILAENGGWWLEGETEKGEWEGEERMGRERGERERERQKESEILMSEK